MPTRRPRSTLSGIVAVLLVAFVAALVGGTGACSTPQECNCPSAAESGTPDSGPYAPDPGDRFLLGFSPESDSANCHVTLTFENGYVFHVDIGFTNHSLPCGCGSYTSWVTTQNVLWSGQNIVVEPCHEAGLAEGGAG